MDLYAHSYDFPTGYAGNITVFTEKTDMEQKWFIHFSDENGDMYQREDLDWPEDLNIKIELYYYQDGESLLVGVGE